MVLGSSPYLTCSQGAATALSVRDELSVDIDAGERLVLRQRPDDPALMREAAQNLWLHGPRLG